MKHSNVDRKRWINYCMIRNIMDCWNFDGFQLRVYLMKMTRFYLKLYDRCYCLIYLWRTIRTYRITFCQYPLYDNRILHQIHHDRWFDAPRNRSLLTACSVRDSSTDKTSWICHCNARNLCNKFNPLDLYSYNAFVPFATNANPWNAIWSFSFHLKCFGVLLTSERYQAEIEPTWDDFL